MLTPNKIASTRLAVVSAVLSFALAETAPAEELFSWDAEALSIIVEGDIATCLSLDGGSYIDVTEKHSGLSSLRHNISDSQRNMGCDAGDAARGGDVFDGGETYYRWWMKISDDMDWGNEHKKAKFGRITRSNQQTPSFTTLYLLDDSFRWAGAFNETGSDNYIDLRTDFDPDDGSCRSSARVSNLGSDCTEWREYIFYFKRNTCPSCENGIARLYVNGQLADERTGVAFAEYVPDDGVTGFRYSWAGVGGKIYPQICPNGDSCGFGGAIWVDDISIATEWNSTEFGQTEQVRPESPDPFVVIDSD